MQHHQVLAVEAKQHARRPFRRQVRPDFPEAVSHRAAHRHAYRPAPLRPQQVLPYPLTPSDRSAPRRPATATLRWLPVTYDTKTSMLGPLLPSLNLEDALLATSPSRCDELFKWQSV